MLVWHHEVHLEETLIKYFQWSDDWKMAQEKMGKEQMEMANAGNYSEEFTTKWEQEIGW